MLANADVVIAYNDSDARAREIDNLLVSAGLSTFFVPHDDRHPSPFAFEQMLQRAKVIVILLGASGLSEMQKMYIEAGRRHKLRFLPALIDTPSDADLTAIGAVVELGAITDLRGRPTPAVLRNFCEDAAGTPRTADVVAATDDEPLLPGEAEEVAYQVLALTQGSERDKLAVLDLIRTRGDGWRARFGARLRNDITTVYQPVPQASDYTNAQRKELAAKRAWLFSALLVCDPHHPATLALSELSIDQKNEPSDEVRFRVLAGAYQADTANLGKLQKKGARDPAILVSALARAIADSEDPALVNDFDRHSSERGFEGGLAYLRAMRVVAIPALAVAVARLFSAMTPSPEQAATIFYALRHSSCAQRAAPQLSISPGIDRVLELVMGTSANAGGASAEHFLSLIRAFSLAESVPALYRLRDNFPRYRAAAQDMLRLLEGEPDNAGEIAVGETLQAAGYRSDTIGAQADRLGIAREVHVLTTLMLSKDVVPPLAIGLFGNWGSGKSFFMHSMHKQARTIASNAEANKSKRFCANIVQIEFNAWHYADTSLWASLVTRIFENLQGHFSPSESSPQLHASASEKVAGKQTEVAQARAAEEKAFIELERDKALKAELEAKREAGDIPLSAYSMNDVNKLLEKNPELKATVQQALNSLAFPKALQDVHSLGAALVEAQSTFGRFAGLIAALCRPRTLGLFVAALLLVLLGIPALVHRLKLDPSLSMVGAQIAQFGAAAAAIATWLRHALGRLNQGLEKVNQARTGIEQIVKDKKAELKSPEEKDVEARITSLTDKLRQQQDEVQTVEHALKKAQDELDAMTQQASLKHFLAERLHTNDYSKHQGLVATVRDDFNKLAKLINEQCDDDARLVERVILYIDDLDRCAAPKVVEVLQAVHLLLAYPLFVVVVGVDARWLMHSLSTHYRQLSGSGNGVDADWAAKPQHYLEKIFQITYALKPMNPEGFGDLIEELMGGGTAEAQSSPEMTFIEAKRWPPAPSSPVKAEEPGPAMAAAGPGTELVFAPSEAVLIDDDPRRAPGPQPSLPAPDEIDMVLMQSMGQAENPQPSMWAEEEVMTLQPMEGRFARKLHQFIPSPRAAKRLANIYRILKAGLPRYRVAEFEGSADMPGQFRVPMLLLAILIHDSEAAEIVFRALLSASGRFDMAVALHSVVADTSNAALMRVVELTLQTCEAEGLQPEQELFRRWIPEVSRFSFGMS